MNRLRAFRGLEVWAGAFFLSATVFAAPLPMEEVLAETLAPYHGPSSPGVDASTPKGKVLCGYQGWFNCEGDGAQRGWVHWVKSNGTPSPENIKVDLWPDVSELGPAERFDTAFHHADGSIAQVFSSFPAATVLRHFRWMREYGVDGAFVQRFANGVRSPDFQRNANTILAHCREGANREGRVYALMYDLSGLGAGRIDDVIQDWRTLHTRMALSNDPAYLHDRGRPLVAVWGVGFNDRRAYTLDDCRKLIEALKSDGCAVMLGVPTYWRERKNDAVPDARFHDVIALADIVNPWTVGRYRSPDQADRYANQQIPADLAWCAEHQLDYLPVIFPGFSWRNMYGQSNNAIPRLKGEFFWRQFQAVKRCGASMIYVAMFDEVDEGTAIFKCTNDVPPANEAPFVTFEGLPSDYYLQLAGAGGRLLRGEIPADSPLPAPRSAQ